MQQQTGKNKNFSLKNRLIFGTLFIILILFIILTFSLFFMINAWLYTYQVFTQETELAEIEISERVIKDGIPTFHLKYTSKNLAKNYIFYKTEVNDNNLSLSSEFRGDKFMIEAIFVKWKDICVMLGLKPMLKVYRIQSDYIKKDKNYPNDYIDINGGFDKTFYDFYENKYLDSCVDTVFISGAGNQVINEKRKYALIATEDALVIRKKD